MPEHLAEAKVHSLLDMQGSNWDIELIDDIFEPADRNQIMSIPIPLGCHADKLIWRSDRRTNGCIQLRVLTELFRAGVVGWSDANRPGNEAVRRTQKKIGGTDERSRNHWATKESTRLAGPRAMPVGQPAKLAGQSAKRVEQGKISFHRTPFRSGSTLHHPRTFVAVHSLRLPSPPQDRSSSSPTASPSAPYSLTELPPSPLAISCIAAGLQPSVDLQLRHFGAVAETNDASHTDATTGSPTMPTLPPPSPVTVRTGAENDIVLALVIFSIQYALVNHEFWKYKVKHARWKVSLKSISREQGKRFSKFQERKGIIDKDVDWFHQSVKMFEPLPSGIIQTVAWRIWSERNNRLWNGLKASHFIVIAEARAFILAWHQVHDVSQMVPRANYIKKWEKPPQAVDTNSKTTGFGFIVRDCQGDFVAAVCSSWSGILEPKIAKLFPSVRHTRLKHKATVEATMDRLSSPKPRRVQVAEPAFSIIVDAGNRDCCSRETAADDTRSRLEEKTPSERERWEEKTSSLPPRQAATFALQRRRTLRRRCPLLRAALQHPRLTLLCSSTCFRRRERTDVTAIASARKGEAKLMLCPFAAVMLRPNHRQGPLSSEMEFRLRR
nr:uncharacterized protein LOC109164950 [Ipomoea trifida]